MMGLFQFPIRALPSGGVAVAGAIDGPAGNTIGGGLRYDLPNLRKKLADVASNAGECIIGIIGDSHNLAVGGGVSGTYLLVDACKYAPGFVAGRKLAGSLGIPVTDDGWWGWRGYNTLVTLDQFDSRTVTTGTWTSTSSSNTGLGSGALRETSGSGTYTYTAKRNWDKAEIWVQQNTGATGTLVASATGATSVPLTLLGGAAALTKFTITKSAVNANPLVLTCSVAMSAYVGVAAINFIDSTQAAVRIQNHAMSGKKMTDHVVASHPYSNLNAYQTAGIAADVLLVECLHNSILAAAETLEVWLASWETFLAAMDTATRDIIVYIGYPGNYTWATDGTMDTWIAALKVKLDARGINMFDLRDIYGAAWADGNAEGLMYDSGHPNKRGLALYGAKMGRDLLELSAPW